MLILVKLPIPVVFAVHFVQRVSLKLPASALAHRFCTYGIKSSGVRSVIDIKEIRPKGKILPLTALQFWIATAFQFPRPDGAVECHSVQMQVRFVREHPLKARAGSIQGVYGDCGHVRFVCADGRLR